MNTKNICLLKLGYSGKTPTHVALLANIVIDRAVSGICLIPIIPSVTVPSIVEIEGQVKKVLDAVRLPNSEAAAELRQQEKNTLIGMLQKLGSYYEIQADGDRLLLATTGYELKKSRVEPTDGYTSTPKDLFAKQGRISCQAIISATADQSIRLMEVQYSTNPDPESDDWMDGGSFTTFRHMVIDGLPRGVDLYIRARGHGPHGPSAWSFIATIMVV